MRDLTGEISLRLGRRRRGYGANGEKKGTGDRPSPKIAEDRETSSSEVESGIHETNGTDETDGSVESVK
jgi:hypothetical protein